MVFHFTPTGLAEERSYPGRLSPAGSPDLYVATQKNHKELQPQQEAPPPRGRIPAGLSATGRMARKLLTQAGRAIYQLQGQTVEPVFGQIKRVQGIDEFSGRGLEMCEGEWALICSAHNLLKLFRSGQARFGV